MNNIKRKILKFILSFLSLTLICACNQSKNYYNKQNTPEKFVELALLLPLSGSDAELGKECAQMIKIGLSDGLKTKVHLTAYDSSNEEILNQSIEKIIDQGTDIIIGPIYSEATKIVANKVKGKGIIVLSLSNNPVLADKQVFVFGHAPMRQLEQLTKYLLDKHYQNYITLLPAGRYSTTISQILKDIINKNDAIFAKIEFYDNDPENMKKSLRVVSDMVDNLNENDFNLTQPVVILGDDSASISILLKEMKGFNLDKKAVIAGDNRIDVNINEPIDITFTGSIKFIDSKLSEKASKIRINNLSFMHVLAYDSGLIMGECIGNQYIKLKFLERINSSEPFYGASGTINFVDSIAQRKYDIIRKQGSEYISSSL